MPPDYEIADWCLVILTTIAFFTSAWRMAVDHKITSLPRWCVLVGWCLLSVRLWAVLITTGDAPIHPASLIALTVLACGHSLLQIRSLDVPQWWHWLRLR